MHKIFLFEYIFCFVGFADFLETYLQGLYHSYVLFDVSIQRLPLGNKSEEFGG